MINPLKIGLILLLISTEWQRAYCAERVRTGLEVLLQERLELIQGKRLGIIANHTSCDADGRHILELLAPHAQITAIFALEHGLTGLQEAGETVSGQEDKKTKIFSLYGQTKKPTPEMLKEVDLLIYDVQDVGARFYTFISSLFYVLEAARGNRIPVLVLDRPNPIGAHQVEGPLLQAPFNSFVGIAPLPIRYGMTIGELAKYLNEMPVFGEEINANLTVIEMKGYNRSLYYDETGIPWISPSPNIPGLETALAYPGFCLFEGTNLSEGRGTDAPFLTIGAPFIDAAKWIASVPTEYASGVQIEPIRFTPRSLPGKAAKPKYMDQACNGILIRITNRDEFKPINLAVTLLCSAFRQNHQEFKMTQFLDQLWGSSELRFKILEGAEPQEILEISNRDSKQFMDSRIRLY